MESGKIIHPADRATVGDNETMSQLEIATALANGGDAELETIADRIPLFTGFDSPDDVTIEYDYTTRTVTMTQSGGVKIWYAGKLVTLESPWTSDAHDATNGAWFLTLNDNTPSITWQQVVWTIGGGPAPMAAVYYNSGTGVYFGLRECHAAKGVNDQRQHRIDHFNIGTFRYSGGELTGGTYQEQPGAPADADNTPGFDAAVIYDEDLKTELPAWSQGSYTLLKFSGSGTPVFTASASLPFAVSGTYPNYNPLSGGSFSDVEAATLRYFNVWQLMLPVMADAESQKYRFVIVQPQNLYTSLAAAQAESPAGLNLGSLSSFSPEFCGYARITFGTLASYSTTGKCRIEDVAYEDSSRTSLAASAGSIAYDMLSAQAKTPVPITGGVTLDATAFGKWHYITGTSGNYSINLPAVAAYSGRWIGFRVGASAVANAVYTLDPNGTEKINEASTLDLAYDQALALLCDGSRWIVVAIGKHGQAMHDSTVADIADVTYETLNSNGDVGTGASTLAAGNDSRFPTSDEKAGLAANTPTAADPVVVESMLSGKTLTTWIVFDGTGTIAIDDSYNITSIADNGTGDYTVTIDEDAPSAPYDVVGSGSNGGNAVGGAGFYPATVGTFTVKIVNNSSDPADVDTICAQCVW